MVTKKDQIRQLAEGSLESFIRLVHPQRVLGSVHVELTAWMTRQNALSHQLVLLPRDHQKSAMAAYLAAWEITRNPCIRILYISSTANLAVKQLKFIKDIITSDIYRSYWPEMVNVDEGRREKWTETEVSVDHPLRKAEVIRDPTVFTAGLTTAIVGLHCDLAIMDDVVTNHNAYTEDGREKTKQQYSLLSSIEAGDARELIVGTRYHPKDLYNDVVSMEVDQYDSDGNDIESIPLYETFERQVENVGDGNGEFLWPTQKRYDGKSFGFDAKILAKKRAQYSLNMDQYYAQYYNNPNSIANAGINREYFQYYEKQHLNKQNGRWFFKTQRLNVFASVDFAYSLNKAADNTAIVVIGVDSGNNYYILDIDRFKTDQISEYYKHILTLYSKWEFTKLRAEVTAAQQVIVADLKQNYIKKNGLNLSIEDHRPNRYQGSKEERIAATLQSRYANLQIWHYLGGHCQTLEEELILRKPPHDDIKDALATCIEICIPPASQQHKSNVIMLQPASRFGGF